jgi:hypothetical protein
VPTFWRSTEDAELPTEFIAEISEPPLTPLELLFEPSGLPEFDLPSELRRLYGGGLGFAAPIQLEARFHAQHGQTGAVEDTR